MIIMLARLNVHRTQGNRNDKAKSQSSDRRKPVLPLCCFETIKKGTTSDAVGSSCRMRHAQSTHHRHADSQRSANDGKVEVFAPTHQEGSNLNEHLVAVAVIIVAVNFIDTHPLLSMKLLSAPARVGGRQDSSPS